MMLLSNTKLTTKKDSHDVAWDHSKMLDETSHTMKYV